MRRTPSVLAGLFFLVTVALALPAMAAPSPSGTGSYTNDEGGEVTNVGPDRQIIYEDEQLEGELPRPSGERITARHSAKHPSLIQLRVRFNDHLIRLSADI